MAILLALICAYVGVRYSTQPDRAARCPAGSFCLYGGKDGTLMTASAPAAAWDLTGSGGPVRTVRNSSQYWACLYEKPSFGGRVGKVPPGGTQDMKGSATPSVASIKAAKSQAGCLSDYERCPERSLCLFREPSGRGPMQYWTAAAPEYGSDWHGGAGSVWNRSVQAACLYPAPGYRGQWTAPDGQHYDSFVVPPGSSTTLGAPYQTAVGSHRLVDDPSEC